MDSVNGFIIFFAALALGMLLAGIHFGGLWLTVKMLPRCERPRLFFWSSYFGRHAVTLWSFAQIMKHGPMPLASACLGFYLLRTIALSKFCGVGIGGITELKGASWK